MNAFNTLGSVDTFASREGLDSRDPATLGAYTTQLACIRSLAQGAAGIDLHELSGVDDIDRRWPKAEELPELPASE